MSRTLRNRAGEENGGDMQNTGQQNSGRPLPVPVSIEDVLITPELVRRPSRSPDYAAENRAILTLADEMTANPAGALQKLAELVLDMCRAGSAGLSLLEPAGDAFRWHAAAGAFAPLLHGTSQREATCCGAVIARNQTLLTGAPGRHFPAIAMLGVPICEYLLMPWHLQGKPVGTLSVAVHTPDRQFDAEDARLLENLSRFASAAYQTVSALQNVKAGNDELERRVMKRTRALSLAYEELRCHETRDGLLLRLLRDQRRTVDPLAMMRTAAETVGQHLEVDRVGFFEMADDDTLCFTSGWTGGPLPALTGTFPAAGLGIRYLAEARSGRTLGIEDVSYSPLTADSAFASIGTVSLVYVPIVRFGRWYAGMYVNHSQPRKWVDDEIAFVREVAEQTWDAVERAKAQRALGISEERLRLAVESAGQATWRYDPRRGFLIADAHMQSLFAMAEAEAPLECWFAAIHEHDRARARAEFTEAAHGEHPFDSEFRVVQPVGIRWVRGRARLISDKGAPGRMVGICEDITTRKLAETSLQQTEKLAAMGRLASSIAHEINNPLESVTNLLYLARISEDPAAVRSYLDNADQELRRASSIANQTLRFHKQSTTLAAVSCEELFASTLAIYQGRLRHAHVAVDKRKRARRPLVCYEGEIRQVLSNLISNAIDAMSPVGGRLLLRSRDGMDWKTGHPCLILTIADTGPGMSPETLAKVFEPFFTTKGTGGTGLGLWISQEIIHRHHGRLSIRSSQKRPNSGTVFRLLLPLDTPIPESQQGLEKHD